MREIHINVKITAPGSFTFRNDESEAEGVLVKLVDAIDKVSGTVEQSVVLGLGYSLELRTTQGNELMLVPEEKDGVEKIFRAESVWATVYLIPEDTKDRKGFFHFSDLVKIGRAMVVVINCINVQS